MSKKTFVTFVLDETGSMAAIKDDTIGGFNEYLKSLKESDEEYLFTLVKFDSNKHDVVCKGIPVLDVSELTKDTYTPGAATPLIDACVKAIKATEEKVREQDVNVVVAVQTDGYENASLEYKNEDLLKLVKEKTSEGWLFTFIGAGIDAFDQAGRWGFQSAHTMSYGMDKSAQAFAAVGRATATYASTGSSNKAAYTNAERVSVGDSTATPPPKQKKDKTSLIDDMKI